VRVTGKRTPLVANAPENEWRPDAIADAPELPPGITTINGSKTALITIKFITSSIGIRATAFKSDLHF
jgi:hypothetical protein